MLSLNTNVASLFGAMMLNRNSAEIAKVSQQISSGKRILTASDDPAGMGVLSTLKAQESSYNAVQKNLSAGSALLKTAETSLKGQQGILLQMKDLATQASSALLSVSQRAALISQFGELKTQLDNTVNTANLFGQNLTGTAGANVVIQSGINSGDTKTITATKSDAATLALTASALTDPTTSAAAMTSLDAAVATVSTNQATIGTQLTGLTKMGEAAKENQLNLQSAISSIEDADIPALSAQLAQLQVKQQLQTNMLALTNAMPNSILQLIR